MQQKAQVEQYLQGQNVIHSGVGEWPAFEVAPYFAIWAIQSKIAEGRVGWWAFSGDIPTDYVSGQNLVDPRAALGCLLKTWGKYVPYLKVGANPPGIEMGNVENRKELGDLLEKRIHLLEKCYANDDLWRDVFDESK